MNADQDTLDRYIVHPEHEMVKKIQGPMVADKFVVDISKAGSSASPVSTGHALMFAAAVAVGYFIGKSTS